MTMNVMVNITMVFLFVILISMYGTNGSSRLIVGEYNPPATLKEANRERVDCPRDGDCIFHAVIAAGQYEVKNVADVREMIWQKIWNIYKFENGEFDEYLQPILAMSMEDDDRNFDENKTAEFQEDVLTNGRWTKEHMDCIPALLSRMFHVNVYVYDTDGNLNNDVSIRHDEAEIMPIYVVFTGFHYDATAYIE